MPGEVVRDERPQDPEQAFKVNTFIPAVVSVQSEFKHRFTDTTVDILRQMKYFTPRFLLSESNEHPDIDKLCSFYELDLNTMSCEFCLS